jgi:hypothetical protein
MSFEDRFAIQLGHNLLVVEWKKGRDHDPVTGRSDIWLTRNGRSLTIVETKRPDHKLTDDDAWQSISYARLIKRSSSLCHPYQSCGLLYTRGRMRSAGVSNCRVWALSPLRASGMNQCLEPQIGVDDARADMLGEPLGIGDCRVNCVAVGLDKRVLNGGLRAFCPVHTHGCSAFLLEDASFQVQSQARLPRRKQPVPSRATLACDLSP